MKLLKSIRGKSKWSHCDLGGEEVRKDIDTQRIKDAHGNRLLLGNQTAIQVIVKIRTVSF